MGIEPMLSVKGQCYHYTITLSSAAARKVSSMNIEEADTPFFRLLSDRPMSAPYWEVTHRPSIILVVPTGFEPA